MSETTRPSHEVEEEGAAFLEEQDRKYGKNITEPTIERASLGQARSTQIFESTISSANDSYWKKVPLENLPSRGMFYPDGAELTIRSAEVGEIRHWSTMDEGDVLEVDDTLNFIMEKCTRFKMNNGRSWMTWRDILEIDRLFIIFLIYEITFPTGQNELFAKFECFTGCTEEDRFSDKIKVRSPMLQLFDMPEEVMQWYSPDLKCFMVESPKLNETFYLYMPTLGNIERLRKQIAEVKNSGRPVDKAFIKMAPYLIQDWSKFNRDEYGRLQAQSFAWHVNKFTFITKFAEQMQFARSTMVSTACPKCGSTLTAPIFSQFSFTVKDLLFISGRLNELI